MNKKKKSYHCEKNKVIELNFFSKSEYKDPYNEIILDVIFTDENGFEYIVPSYWCGSNIWTVRFAPSITGEYIYQSKCNIPDPGLDQQRGIISATEYSGKNSLFRHGRLKVREGSKYIEHYDGTPFFWLSDAWYFGLSRRCKWPEVFKIIAQDRINKGFTAVMLVAGRHPDFGEELNDFEANEAGYIGEKDLKNINPYYFDMADLKIFWLLQEGLVPAIAGSWGYHLHWTGIDNMKKYWRYLIARWAAYPVVWIITGEANLQYYLTEKEKIREKVDFQLKGWNEITRYVRETDPFFNPITIHPSPQPNNEIYASRGLLKDQKAYDIDLLQTGQHGKDIMETTLDQILKELKSQPVKPVINGEVCYEGLMGSQWQEVQRFLFWTHMLMGCAGHSYGAEGIWEFRTKEEDYEGVTGRWGKTLWDEALDFKGSYQIGLGKKFLEKFEWWKLESCPDLVTPNWTEGNYYFPHCAKIGDSIRIIYFSGLYNNKSIFRLRKITMNDLDKEGKYKAYYFNPRDGETSKNIDLDISEEGTWVMEGMVTCTPSMEDWVMVIEKVS